MFFHFLSDSRIHKVDGDDRPFLGEKQECWENLIEKGFPKLLHVQNFTNISRSEHEFIKQTTLADTLYRFQF